MSQSEDHTFIRQFSSIIIGLVLLAIALVFVARSMQVNDGEDITPGMKANVAQRISPVSDVYTDAASSAAPVEAPVTPAVVPAPAEAPASTESAPAPAEVQAATAPAVDGEKVYNGLCVGCHAAGVAGAPIAGSEQMGQRLSEKGIDTLVKHAIEGFNVMPPRGGNPGLTDEQIRAAIEFMLP